jgi:hypothetical protein
LQEQIKRHFRKKITWAFSPGHGESSGGGWRRVLYMEGSCICIE